MKSREIIAEATRDWHAVDAAQMAKETFGRLDSDEVIRLATRAFTEEWRGELRRKDSRGVPKYASITMRDKSGDVKRHYKQTALFDAQDYFIAVAQHVNEARSHIRAAKAIADMASQQLDLQISIPQIEAAS